MSKRSVLVVDDNPVNLKLLRFLLVSHGYEVTLAEDAKSAQAALQQCPPDLILMDIQLPDVDGLTLTKTLKSDPGMRHIPILAVTAYAMKGDDVRAHEAGVDGYLTKPIDKQKLLSLVERKLSEVQRPAVDSRE